MSSLCKLCFHSAIWSSGHDDSQLAPLRVGSMIYHTALAYHNFEKNLGCHVSNRFTHRSTIRLLGLEASLPRFRKRAASFKEEAAWIHLYVTCVRIKSLDPEDSSSNKTNSSILLSVTFHTPQINAHKLYKWLIWRIKKLPCQLQYHNNRTMLP